jgi:hypothetical protein
MIEGLENAPVTTTESDIPVRYGDVKSVYEPEGEWRYVELAKRPTGSASFTKFCFFLVSFFFFTES